MNFCYSESKSKIKKKHKKILSLRRGWLLGGQGCGLGRLCMRKNESNFFFGGQAG